MEYQYPYNGDEPGPPPPPPGPTAARQEAPSGTDQGHERTGALPPLGMLGMTLLVVGNVLYMVTAIPAYLIYALSTQLLEESQLDGPTFWMSFGWLISFVAGWGAFAWLYRTGAGRSGAAVFFGIFVVWVGTSLLLLFTGG